MDALTLIKTRRSTRKYLQKAVEKEKLEQVIEAGRFAPSGGNNQTTHFIVIQDAAVLENLARIARDEFAKMEVTPDTYASLAKSIKLSQKGTYVFHYNAPVLVLTANRIGYVGNGGPFSPVHLKLIQEVVTLLVFMVFSMVAFHTRFHWNHAVAAVLLVAAVYFVFMK